MIPAFGPSGVLPPFVGDNPAHRPQTSPYRVEMTDIVSRFATSPERADILRGLLGYRAALHAAGITEGIQWIDGSFVEDCETLRRRAPQDVDIVTFAYRPERARSADDWSTFVDDNIALFDQSLTKSKFRCDAYYIDLWKRPDLAVADAAYFNNLFSHQRDTAQWKGMLQVRVRSDDAAARLML